MKDLTPADAVLHQGVSLSMDQGSFPASGAAVTFRLNTPLAAGHEGTIVYWNPDDSAWEPRVTEVSADRLTLTAKLEHFSDYNWIDTTYNVIGKVAGEKTSPPSCPGTTPGWADPGYTKDSINGPVLWCVGTDAKNPDIMEVRLKMNRSTAGSITTVIKPAWGWSDLWQNLTPVTWISMGGSAVEDSNLLGDQYLVQPLGEYRFGFDRKQLLELWATNPDKPLIQVDSSPLYTVAGLMYQAVEGKFAGNMAGVFIMTSLMQCGGDVASATSEGSVASAFGAVVSCMDSRKDAIAQAVAKTWLNMNPGADWAKSVDAGKAIGKTIGFAGQLYVVIKGTLTLGAFIGDLTLDPIARQLIYRPSTAELKTYVAARNANSTRSVTLDPWMGDGLPANSTAYDSGNVGITCSQSRMTARQGVYWCALQAAPGQSWPVCVEAQDGEKMACFNDFGPMRWDIITNYTKPAYGNGPTRAGFPTALKLADGKHCKLSDASSWNKDASGQYAAVGMCEPYTSRFGASGPDPNTYLWAKTSVAEAPFNKADWFGSAGLDGFQMVEAGTAESHAPAKILEAYFAPQ